MVLHLVGSLAGLVKAHQVSVTTEGFVSRLHYRWTTTFCYLSCALVVASEYIGKAIQCIDGSGNAVAKAITTYCWINSTYTINSTTVPGVDSYYDSTTLFGIGVPHSMRVTFHSYYQWVPFFLFFQGCLFYLPHLLWKALEGKRVDSLLQGLHCNALDPDRVDKRNNIITYLKSSVGRNNVYGLVRALCLTLYLVNLLGQFFLLDVFFGYKFITLGSSVMWLSEGGDSYDPLVETFPRVTMCDFYYTGPGGNLQNTAALCILPQNILNEKVFITMWFWFIILKTVTCLQVLWQVLLMVLPELRVRVLERRGLLIISDRMELHLRRLPLGDFFLLDLLSRNLDAANFKEVLVGATEGSEDNGQPDSYQRFPQPENEDDPILFKRQMEREDVTSV